MRVPRSFHISTVSVSINFGLVLENIRSNFFDFGLPHLFECVPTLICEGRMICLEFEKKISRGETLGTLLS